MTKHNKKIILFSFLHTDPGFSYSLCTTGLKNEIQISSKMKYRFRLGNDCRKSSSP